MPRFQISENNETTNNYLTPIQGDNRYFNMNNEEQLETDLNLGNNKIINVSDESDIVTKLEAEKQYAKPIRELIANDKQFVIDK